MLKACGVPRVLIFAMGKGFGVRKIKEENCFPNSISKLENLYSVHCIFPPSP